MHLYNTEYRQVIKSEAGQGGVEYSVVSSKERDDPNKGFLSTICNAFYNNCNDSNVKVWAAKKYLKSEDKLSDITTLVVMLKNEPKETERVSEFKGYPVHYITNSSAASDCISALNSDVILSSKDDVMIGDVISKNFNNLLKKHSNITKMCPAAVNIRNGKVIHEMCISISCTGKGFVPNGEDVFPSEIEGITVDVLEGSIVPLIDKRQDKLKVSGSISHKDSNSYGTIGGLCSATELAMINQFLTCLHCVFPKGKKYVADALDGIVVQPGNFFEGYHPENECGITRDGVLGHAAYNGKKFYMDAAVIEIDKDRVPDISEFCNILLRKNRMLFDQFFPRGLSFRTVNIHEPFTDIPGSKVFKLGQTTGLTVGEVTSQNAYGVLPYKINLKISFCNVVRIASRGGSPFAEKGDSGSLVFYEKNGKPHLVGIVFCGEIGTTYACHIKPVLQKFKLQFL